MRSRAGIAGRDGVCPATIIAVKNFSATESTVFGRARPCSVVGQRNQTIREGVPAQQMCMKERRKLPENVHFDAFERGLAIVNQA